MAVTAPAEAAEWMLPAEAAEFLGISDTTVVRLFQAGHIPGWREGQIYRLSGPFLRAVKAMTDAGQQVILSAFAQEWRSRTAQGATS